VDQPPATSDSTSSKADEGASTDLCLRHTVGVVQDPVIDASMQAVADARKLNDPAAEARALVTVGSALLRVHRVSEGRYICRQAEKLGYELGDRDIQGQALAALGVSLEELSELDGQGGRWREALLSGAGETQYFSSSPEARSDEFYKYGVRTDAAYRVSELVFAELAVGFVVVKFLGPFAEAFAAKLGERLGESAASAIGRIRLLWNHKDGRKDLDIIVSGSAATTLVLPEDFTDAARLAAIDLDVNAEGVRGAELHWDASAGSWRPVAIAGPEQANISPESHQKGAT
jgi:hypothetical protein